MCCGYRPGCCGCCLLSSALTASWFHPDGDCHGEKRNDFEAGCQGSVENSEAQRYGSSFQVVCGQCFAAAQDTEQGNGLESCFFSFQDLVGQTHCIRLKNAAGSAYTQKPTKKS